MKVLASILIALFTSSAAYAQVCATVFQGPDFTGSYETLYAGDRISNLGDWEMNLDQGHWDNRVTSFKLESGCKLVGFQYLNFGKDYYTDNAIGWKKVWKNRGHHDRYIDLEYTSYNNKISSLKCRCR